MGFFDFDSIEKSISHEKDLATKKKKDEQEAVDRALNALGKGVEKSFELFSSVISEYPQLAKTYNKQKTTTLRLKPTFTGYKMTPPLYRLPFYYQEGVDKQLFVSTCGELQYLVSNKTNNGKFSYTLKKYTFDSLSETMLNFDLDALHKGLAYRTLPIELTIDKELVLNKSLNNRVNLRSFLYYLASVTYNIGAVYKQNNYRFVPIKTLPIETRTESEMLDIIKKDLMAIANSVDSYTVSAFALDSWN